jgi:hypothetical protein
VWCAALFDADAEPSLQCCVQPVLVVGLECVCRPADVAIGSNQQRACLEVIDRTGHEVDAVRPAARGFAHVSAGKLKQHRTTPVQKSRYPSPIVEGDVGHQPPRERMVLTGVVADVGAGEKVCHVFSHGRLLQ